MTTMAIQKEIKDILIQPFKSRLAQKPAAPGCRVTKGEWAKSLDDMGYKNWEYEEGPEERQEAFLNHLRWDIAHRNYDVLKSCISINEEYDEAAQRLDYVIDLYGDGGVVKHGQLGINRGDFLLHYMRMSKYRRKDLIITRIALANVGMLVPYVQLDDVSYNESRTQVQAAYRIVL